MNIFEKLNLAREKFHAMKLTKTGHNKFAGYNYFELGDFLIPALKVFKEVGLTAVVSFDKDMATMTIIDTEQKEKKPTPGLIDVSFPDHIKITSPMGSAALKGCHEVQNIGAVETYQRRYLWVAALEIVEHDALDSSEPVKESKLGGNVTAQVLASQKEQLTDAKKEAIEKLAGYVKGDLESYGAQSAFERIEMEELNDLEKMYLWTLLPSNVRTPIKAYSVQFHSKKVPA